MLIGPQGFCQFDGASVVCQGHYSCLENPYHSYCLCYTETETETGRETETETGNGNPNFVGNGNAEETAI